MAEKSMMTGQEAIAYIHSYSWLGSKPGLSRTAELLCRIGNPEQELKFVHIVGTNGKGSTAAMLSSILTAAGYRTGLYTSPYLHRFHERIMVNGVPISDPDLGEVTAFVKGRADGMEDHPTEFELVTCIALEYYRRSGCQIVVLEAGMGGRLDSTNVIPAPEVVVVTRIGLDHTQQLGDTVEQIAREKAAVIKAGTSVVIYHQEDTIEGVVQEICTEQEVSIFVAAADKIAVKQNDLHGQSFQWNGLNHLHITLLGTTQIKNAAVVLETVKTLRKKNWCISDQAVRAGLRDARWPGRFEVVGRHPIFIVDGGHNPQCAQAVSEHLRVYFPGRKVVFLVGVLADKDYAGLADEIAPLAEGFVVVAPNHERALAPDALGSFLRRYQMPVAVCHTVAAGVELAQKLVGGDGIVCALGSLYMVGDIRACFGLD